MKNLVIMLTVILMWVANRSDAQQIFSPPAERPSITATLAAGAINIDGVLDEAAWTIADSLGDFIQIEPYQGQRAKNKTVVKVLYTDKYLYVGVFCYDSLGRTAIRVPDLKRDFEWRAHDTFAICIDGFNDSRNSLSFATNPFGAQKDYLSFDATLFDGDWNGLWKVRTSINELGWFAEFQLPWKTLRYPKVSTDGQMWGVNFLRLRRASNEISVWSPYPRSFNFNRMEYAGVITKLLPPPPTTNIQVNPYVLSSVNDKKFTFKTGGDLKWAISPNTTADATVNTDFAQADADIQVNNVSRFSVLFPEKRQFFLENASLFAPGLLTDGSTGGNMQMLPFFSRRIGLSEKGRPLPITGGMRFTHRSVSQNAGIMTVRQAPADSNSAVYYGVGRYSRNFGKQNRLGLIGTARSEASGHTNLVYGADGFFRFNAAHSLNFMTVKSSNTDDSGKGLGSYAQYYYVTNKINAWFTETLITKNFNPELGFISRGDVIGTSPGAIANLRGKYIPFKKYLRSYQPAITGSWFHQASTRRLIESEVRITPLWIEMQNGGYVNFVATRAHQELISEFTPLGVPIGPGRYDYERFSIGAGSDPSKKMSYTFQHDFGNYFDGKLKTTNVSVSLIPIPQVSLKANVNRNEFASVGTEDRTKVISLYTIQGRFALNPRVQLTGLYQWNSEGSLDSYNIRLAWEYSPLSYIYVVFNSRESVGTGSTVVSESQGIFKISFLKQF